MVGTTSRRKATAAAALALASALGAAGDAAAGERADLALDLGTRDAGRATALKLVAGYKAPGDPDGKPPMITRLVIDLPAGTRLDGTAAAVCEASDEELRARGSAACPPESRIGDGALVAHTGFGPPADPFRTSTVLFNTPGGFTEIVQQPGTEVTFAAERIAVDGARLSADPKGPPGGPPDGQTTVREVSLSITVPGYVTTPPSCPASGIWSASGTFTFSDGVTVSEPASAPCDPPGAAAAAPVRAPWVSVSPARATPRRATRFRVRLRASDRCRGGALVRLGGRRARTDASGAATLVARLRKGRHRVLVGRHRCPRRSAVVVAR